MKTASELEEEIRQMNLKFDELGREVDEWHVGVAKFYEQILAWDNVQVIHAHVRAHLKRFRETMQ